MGIFKNSNVKIVKSYFLIKINFLVIIRKMKMINVKSCNKYGFDA